VNALPRFLRWRFGLETITPWAEPAETACVIEHARGKRRLAEVGVWEGGTTKHLRTAMAPDGVLFAIDPFPVGRLGFSYQQSIAHAEVARIRNGAVVWLRMRGEEAARDPRVTAAPFDFVLLDSDHTYDLLRAEWAAWAPLVSGVIAVHDVIGDPEVASVRCAREHIFTDARFSLVATAGSLAVLARRR
jgi:hypothetical protein